MMQDTCEPDVCNAQCFYLFEGFRGKIFELANSILFDGAPGFVGGIGIPEESGKDLIYYYFVVRTIIRGQGLLVCRIDLETKTEERKQDQ